MCCTMKFLFGTRHRRSQGRDNIPPVGERLPHEMIIFHIHLLPKIYACDLSESYLKQHFVHGNRVLPHQNICRLWMRFLHNPKEKSSSHCPHTLSTTSASRQTKNGHVVTS